MRFFILPLVMLTPVTLFAEGFYVGTYTKDGSTSKGIYHAQMDPVTGAISDVELASEAANPSFLATSPDGKFVYAAMEDAVPSVGAFRVENGGKLKSLGQLPSDGKDPCHVSVDKTGKFLFVANYTGGNVASFALKPDGSFDKRVSLIQFTGSGPDKGRQASPHAHGIYPTPDNRFVYVCDLGTDKIHILAFDSTTGELTESGFGSVPGGAGPRHLAFTPDGKFVYAANEMLLTVTGFRADAKTGALDAIETVPVHDKRPEGYTSLAEVFVHPNGKWLYVSSRGDNTIALFSIAADGKLTRIENVPAGVKIPRGFALDASGKWLVVAGQDDNRITTLAIDTKTGKLTPVKTEVTVGKPVSILFEK
ncbi:MAG: lactonase family protein [Chthoniobacterales bacterium]